jgi:hypothetical protein
MSGRFIQALATQGLLVVGGLALLVSTSGCLDAPFCFTDCDETASTSVGGAGGSGGAGGGVFGGGGGMLFPTGGAGGVNTCVETGVDEDTCNEIDDDCDVAVDEDVDYSSILHCGTCANNCFTQLLNADPDTITCTWDGTPNTDGTCGFTDCATDYFDLDMDGITCEYYCVVTGADDSVCNNTDDDCDGIIDEDVDLCGDAQNCGLCGVGCEVVNGTGACIDQGIMPCTTANTSCIIDTCNDDDNDGNQDWWDLDTLYTTGCEYNCSLTDGGGGLGVEVCGDGLDNDCDGAIDGVDSDLTGDPQINVVCFGDPDGLCADPSHAGVTTCVGQQIVCTGMNVLFEDDMQDVCNNIDDNCDGAVDMVGAGPAVDAGSSCGTSNVFPCSFGTEQCQAGSLVCVGNIEPGTEVCNGQDDDCDGMIDLTAGNPPSDTGGACDVPIAPPMGVTSPCSPGTLNCVGGGLQCVGSTGPSGPVDGCNDDSNCDGALTGQPNLMSDVNNCGSCGNDCTVGAVNAIWTCNTGSCAFVACQPGFHDLDMNNTCEYGPCIITGAEICDDIDNDCNGLKDDGVGLNPPSTQAVCGVAPAATSAECTTSVAVVCSSGSWQCTFPANVCSPDCATAVETCDSLDNDCDGSIDENVPNIGLPCASDDGLPSPGHGACQTFGTFVCSSPSTTTCSAVASSCALLPQGCDEVCDGVDNDCDGSVDENYLAKGSDAAFFVKPSVTQIDNSPNTWIMSYEASRAGATSNNPSTGNGYHCTGGGCPAGIPDAPLGEVLDQTLACSVPGVLPWFNVDPIEVQQTCDAIGGFICDQSEYQTACEASNSCNWGYNPNDASCLSMATAGKFCNLSPFDFDAGTTGIQDGLLPGASPLLSNCWADWAGFFGNTETEVFDITGNLREITKLGLSNAFPLMGGGFNSPDEGGATCQFDFYVVDDTFKLLDTGFRCCFDSDPRL